MDTRLSRLAPLTGIAFTVLLAVAMIGPSTPDVNASPAKIISFYGSHRGALQVQAYFLAYAAIMLVCFVGYFAAQLRRAGTRALGMVAFGGSILIAAAMTFGAMCNFMLTHKSVTLAPSTAQALNLMNNDLVVAALAAGLFLVLVPFGIAVVTTRVLPAWVGWVAIVLGIAAATGSFLTWVAGAAAGLWVLGVSIVMLIRERKGMTITLPAGEAVDIPAQQRREQRTPVEH